MKNKLFLLFLLTTLACVSLVKATSISDSVFTTDTGAVISFSGCTATADEGWVNATTIYFNNLTVGLSFYSSYEQIAGNVDGCSLDNIPPTFTNCRNFTTFTNTSFSQYITATDNIAVANYVINQTDKFTVGATTGLIKNATYMPNAQFWNIELSVNDTSNNIQTCVFWINITNQIVSNITVKFKSGVCPEDLVGYYNQYLPHIRKC